MHPAMVMCTTCGSLTGPCGAGKYQFDVELAHRVFLDLDELNCLVRGRGRWGRGRGAWGEACIVRGARWRYHTVSLPGACRLALAPVPSV